MAALICRHSAQIPHEVRDGSVVDLLAALNTGHDGGCGTLHANSAADVPARVEALALAAGLGREATHAQLGSALDVVVHLERSGPHRLLREVAVPVRGADGWVEVHTAVRFDDDGAVRRGPGAPLLAGRLR